MSATIFGGTATVSGGTFNNVVGEQQIIYHNHYGKDELTAGKVQQWLRTPDTARNHNDARKKHYGNTCAWLLNDIRYTSWKTEENSFLWIHGIPGSGKTIICSTIIHDIQQLIQQESTALAYFYFDISDNSKQTTESLLCSLISRLTHQKKEMPPYLAALYRKYEPDIPPEKELQEIFYELVASFGKTYLIIDALDECKETTNLLDFILSIHNHRIPCCHLLVASRQEQEIFEALQLSGITQIRLSSDNVNDDIKAYISHVLAHDQKLKKWDPKIKKEIEKTTLMTADGMFQLVSCQLSELRKCLNQRKLKEVMAKLPQTLDDTYNMILQRIDNDYAPMAAAMLFWLLLAMRPLKLEELAAAAAFDISTKQFHCDNIIEQPDAILEIFSSLVTRNDDATIVLSHASVKEYLLKGPRKIGPIELSVCDVKEGHAYLAQSCLIYLLQFDYVILNHTAPVKFPLARYSAQYWPNHYALSDNDSTVAEHVKQLFQLKDCQFLNWVRLYDVDENVTCFKKSKLVHRGVADPLYYAALLNIKPLVELLCTQNNINVHGGMYITALGAASYMGNISIVELLLKRGADPNSGYAVFAASQNGHINIVEMLLNHGADVNCKGKWGSTALHAASDKGHKDIVTLLLDKGAVSNDDDALFDASKNGHKFIVEALLSRGASANSKDIWGKSALYAASCNGHKHIVEMLVDKKACPDDSNAIYAASENGHAEIVKMLLELGADANRKEQDKSVLSIASKKGYISIVEMLLSKGADPNDVDALSLASQSGHIKIVKILLSRGAQVNVRNDLGWTPLKGASKEGHKDIVQMLLDSGSNAEDNGALYSASEKGHQAIVEVLLNCGANINGKVLGKSALHGASMNGHTTIVSLLLDKGAEVDDCDALCAASEMGNRAIVEVLLDKGASVNGRDKHNMTALLAASKEGHSEIVEILLNKGANINDGIELYAASEKGHTVCAEVLLNHGADSNAKNEYGRAALYGASNHGHRATVKVLLKHGATSKDNDTLYAASENGHKDIVELLLDNGADINGKAKYTLQVTALYAASQKSHTRIVEMLLDRGANANDGDALCAASEIGNLAIVEMLLSNNADANGRERWGKTPLEAASGKGHLKIVEVLLDMGANINDNDALWAAAGNGHRDVVKMLLESGADATGRGRWDETPMMAASQNGYTDVVAMLLNHL